MIKLGIVGLKGGPGSGNYGHAGRPGMVGGSGGVGGIGGVGGNIAQLEGVYKGSGGVDEWGDPIPSPREMADASAVLIGIMADERLRNLAVALAADGDVAGLENFDELKGVDLVGVMASVDPEMEGAYSDTAIGKKLSGIYTQMYGNYEVAISKEGHWQESATMTSEREAWERVYYGKVVGGHEKGWKFAVGELNEYIAERVVH